MYDACHGTWYIGWGEGMNVRNCRKCGRVFNYVMGAPVCPRCREEQEKVFQEVKKYVQEHPGADIMEVAEECNVEPAQIRQWIREDRLQFAEDSPIRIPCEKCGVMMRSGRFCDKCRNNMTDGFKQVLRQSAPARPAESSGMKKSDKDKMRFL